MEQSENSGGNPSLEKEKPAGSAGQSARKRAARLLKRAILAGYRLLARSLPVNRRIIVFQSSLGRDAGGNPRAVCNELVRRGLSRRFRCYYILNGKIPRRTAGRRPSAEEREAEILFYYGQGRSLGVGYAVSELYDQAQKNALYSNLARHAAEKTGP